MKGEILADGSTAYDLRAQPEFMGLSMVKLTRSEKLTLSDYFKHIKIYGGDYLSLPQISHVGSQFVKTADNAFDVVNLGSNAYTIGGAAAGAGSLAKIFSIGSKMTSWLGWGVLAFQGIEFISDVIIPIFRDEGIDVDEKDLSKFLALNGELFVYSHILLNYDLSDKFTFNIFNADISKIVGDLNEDGKIDIADLIIKDIQSLPTGDEAFQSRIEQAIEDNDINGYIKAILAAKAGTADFPNVIESLYKNWLSFCYDKNIWRAFPAKYQTRVQAIQRLVDRIYHIAIIDSSVANYVHNYSEYSFEAIQEEILHQLPNGDEDDVYQDVFGRNKFLWEVVPGSGSFRG